MMLIDQLLANLPGIGTGGTLVGGGMLVKHLLENRVKMRELRGRERNDEDTIALATAREFRDELNVVRQEIDVARQEQARERETCDRELRAQRHEMTNLKQGIMMLLMTIEVAPEKAAVVAARMREEFKEWLMPSQGGLPL